jgi:formiminoglutamase
MLDFGNITCEDGNLENTQNNLAKNVSKVLLKEGNLLF